MVEEDNSKDKKGFFFHSDCQAPDTSFFKHGCCKKGSDVEYRLCLE